MVPAGEGWAGAGGVDEPALGVAALADGAAMVTFPSLNPASCKVRLTLPKGWPTKLGITKACGFAATVTSRLVFGADTWFAFGGGLWAST